jgi:hypothetical protein
VRGEESWQSEKTVRIDQIKGGDPMTGRKGLKRRSVGFQWGRSHAPLRLHLPVKTTSAKPSHDAASGGACFHRFEGTGVRSPCEQDPPVSFMRGQGPHIVVRGPRKSFTFHDRPRTHMLRAQSAAPTEGRDGTFLFSLRYFRRRRP